MYACEAAQVYLESQVQHDAARDIVVRATASYLATTTKGCHECGVTGDEKELLMCARCHQAQYCGPECQKAAWKTHKPDCTLRLTIDSLQESRESFKGTCLNMIKLYLEVVTDGGPAFADWDQSAAQKLLAEWSNTDELA
jgi:hypothetical protein